MLIVISPAKTLDFNKINETLPISEPRFLEKSRIIIEELKEYDIFLVAYGFPCRSLPVL